MINLSRITIPTDNNLKLQKELSEYIFNSLNSSDFKEIVKIEWRDNILFCSKTKQGVINIKQWEEQFKKYACWRFTKKKELSFDNYENDL